MSGGGLEEIVIAEVDGHTHPPQRRHHSPIGPPPDDHLPRNRPQRSRPWVVPAAIAAIICLSALAAGVLLFRPGGDRSAPGPGEPPPVPQDVVRIPGGAFPMGCNAALDPRCEADEDPAHMVYLDPFEIHRREVTVREYGLCVAGGACKKDHFKSVASGNTFCNFSVDLHEEHPMNCVDWIGADAYCRWMGMRLPTEAEWEMAARGPDGRSYPWGDRGFEATGRVANIADLSLQRDQPDVSVIAGYDDGFHMTAPVGSFPDGASPFGALDMAGNVWEWVSDRYDAGYYENSPERSPAGPETEHERVVRGGAWADGPSEARTTARGSARPEAKTGILGFRCAATSPSP
ncbi:MAG: SUMF1/EgtB/PvdO family nonheme iron enzyme [Pseudomonadota bacterium]